MSVRRALKTKLPDRFILRPARSDEVLAISSGVLRHAVFAEDHYTSREDGPRAERGGLYCPKIFGALEGPLEDDRRRERLGHVELAAPMSHPWFAEPLRHLVVLPPGYRPFQRTPEGRLCEHDVSELYGRLIAANAQLVLLVKMKAPEAMLAGEKDKLRIALARLVDNEACGDETFLRGGRPARGLAAHLGTNDLDELGALLLALGLVAEPKVAQ